MKKQKPPPTALFFNYELALQQGDIKAARQAARSLKASGFIVKCTAKKSNGGVR